MRISDWSSDVCSSDLIARRNQHLLCPDGLNRYNGVGTIFTITGPAFAGQFDSVNCVCDTLIADARAYTHAFGLQIGLQSGAHFRVHFGEQAAEAKDGKPNTKTGR